MYNLIVKLRKNIIVRIGKQSKLAASLSLFVIVSQLVSGIQPSYALSDFTPPSPITATPINMNTQSIAPGVLAVEGIFVFSAGLLRKLVEV